MSFLVCCRPGILPKALCKRKMKAGREFFEQDLSFIIIINFHVLLLV